MRNQMTCPSGDELAGGAVAEELTRRSQQRCGGTCELDRMGGCAAGMGEGGRAEVCVGRHAEVGSGVFVSGLAGLHDDACGRWGAEA